MDTTELAIGRWHGILSHFGVRASYLSGKHGPCPLCGGRDRWRFDNKKGRGTWYCTKCGAGDGFKLVGLLLGKASFRDIKGEVAKVVGGAAERVWSKPDPKEQEGRMASLWKLASPLRERDAVMRYLGSRGLRIVHNQLHDLRCHENIMYALVRDAGGRVTQMHRTDIIKRERKYMGGLTLPAGCAVRLMTYNQGGPIGIAEGIETALSAAQLYKTPCWAALDEQHLAKWEPPQNVKHIVIFGDNDENYVGQSAAYLLARRLAGSTYKVSVMIPDKAGYDWNDVLQKRTPPACTDGAK